MTAEFDVFVNEDHYQLPTLYWLPKRHKKTYKSHIIANFSQFTTTELTILLTSCLTAIKYHEKNILNKFMRGMIKSFLVYENFGRDSNELNLKIF